MGRNACSFQSGNNFSFSLRKGEWWGEEDSPGRKEGEVGVGKQPTVLTPLPRITS